MQAVHQLSLNLVDFIQVDVCLCMEMVRHVAQDSITNETKRTNKRKKKLNENWPEICCLFKKKWREREEKKPTEIYGFLSVAP